MKKPPRCYKCALYETAHKNQKHNFIPSKSVRKVSLPSSSNHQVLHYGERYSACGVDSGVVVSFFYMVTCKKCRLAAIRRATTHEERHIPVPPVFGDLPKPLCFPDELVMNPHYYFLYSSFENPTNCMRCLSIRRQEGERRAKVARREAKTRARLEKQRQQREPQERTPRSRRTPIREKRAQQRAGMGRALRPKDRRSAKPRSVRSRS